MLKRWRSTPPLSSHACVLRTLCLAATLLIAACSLMPNQQTFGVDEVEQALLPIADIAIETGQMETAQRLYRRLLDVDPESHAARMGLGDVAFKERHSADAVDWYLDAQTYATTPAQLYDALLWHGRAALDAGQLEVARRSFEQLTDARAADVPTITVAWALNGIGLTLLLEGDLHGAVAFMEKAVRSAPSEQRFADNLARAWAMLADAPAPQSTPSTPTAEQRAADRERPEPRAEAVETEAEVVEPVAEAVEPVTEAVEAEAEAVEPVTEAVEPAAEPDVTTMSVDDNEERSSADNVWWPNIESGYIVRTEEGVFVQMGAYSQRATAETVAYLLSDITHEIVRVAHPQEQDAEELYHVRIGPIESNAALAELADSLDAEGYGHPKMLQNTDTTQLFNGVPDGFVVQEGVMRFLQLGAFEVRMTANRLADRLRELTDHTVTVAESTHDEAMMYRVRVGPIESDESLEELTSVLVANGYDIQ